jgi:hypothetical protein
MTVRHQILKADATVGSDPMEGDLPRFEEVDKKRT